MHVREGKLWTAWKKYVAALFLCAGAPLAPAPFALGQGQAHVTPSANAVEGTWQGTLHAGAGHDLRLVLKVSREGDAPLAVSLFSIDQGGQALPASKVSFENGILRFTIAGPDLHYEGKLSADGNTLTGTSTQFDNPMPLNLDRTTPATAWEIPKPPPPMKNMAADANPSFEVATIKPNQSGQDGKGFTLRGDHILTINTSVVDLLCFAYGLNRKQIVGGPDWTSSEKFDIDGKADVPGLPSIQQTGIMLKKLLADRFQLKVHQDQREMSAYVLTVVPGGPKLDKGSAPDAIPGLFFSQMGNLHVRDATLQEFANLMETTVFERPVVDHTDVHGRFTFNLRWQPDETQFGGAGAKAPQPAAGTEAPPPLFTAIKEQLGLQLTAGKPEVPVLVIDHVERPSAN